MNWRISLAHSRRACDGPGPCRCSSQLCLFSGSLRRCAHGDATDRGAGYHAKSGSNVTQDGTVKTKCGQCFWWSGATNWQRHKKWSQQSSFGVRSTHYNVLQGGMDVALSFPKALHIPVVWFFFGAILTCVFRKKDDQMSGTKHSPMATWVRRLCSILSFHTSLRLLNLITRGGTPQPFGSCALCRGLVVFCKSTCG